MTNKIRVAQLVGCATLGGVSHCVLNYFRNLDREKFEFDFITYGVTPLDDKIRELGGRVFYVRDFKNPIAGMQSLRKILKENHYDIFHAHLTSLSVFALYEASKAKIPVRICHSHSTTDNKERYAFIKNFLRRYSNRYATDLFSCSDYSAEWLFGSNKDVYIMRNAVNLERFTFNHEWRDNLRSKFCVSGVCLGFAGRFEYQKNLFFLLDIAKRLSEKVHCDVVLVGGGSLLMKLRNYAETNFINSVFISGTDKIEQYFSMFDCLVMPSKYEGLPLVGVEAQSCCLPCFFSDKITKEADVSGKSHFLPLDNADAWAEKILDIIKSKPVRTDCHQTLIDKGYDIYTEAKKLEAKYTELVQIADAKVKLCSEKSNGL